MRKTFRVLMLVTLMTALFIGPALSAASRVEGKGVAPERIAGVNGLNSVIRGLMDQYKVPGLSIAIIKNFTIDFSKGYGVKNESTKQPVQIGTVFQAASVSKAITAAATVKVVYEGLGVLDEDVNNVLACWKLKMQDGTPADSVTLRLLLTHESGIPFQGYDGYCPHTPQPTLMRVLDGRAPATNPAVYVESEPGNKFEYSGGGYVVVQQLLKDTTGQVFPSFMEQYIIGPIGLQSSSFFTPPPGALVERLASGHSMSAGGEVETVPCLWNAYTAKAAAGLWTTASDLAQILIEIQNAVRGQSAVFTQPMMEEMLSWNSAVSDSACTGLGFFLASANNSRQDPVLYFYHSGNNKGFKSFVIAHKTKGYGAVMLINTDYAYSLNVFMQTLMYVAQSEGWDPFTPPDQPVNCLTN